MQKLKMNNKSNQSVPNKSNLKKIAPFSLLLFALASCSWGTQDTTPPAQHKSDGAPSTAATQPELGTFGIRLEDIDPTVNPGDDFFQHVGGIWMDSFEIPSDRSRYGSFTVLTERSEQRVREIIENASKANASQNSIEQKIGALYASYIDVEKINANGISPLADDLDFIADLKTHDDIAIAFAKPDLRAHSPVGAFIGVDSKRPDQYSVYLTQSGLGMPNKTYYLDAKFAEKKEQYKDYISQTLNLADFEDANSRAEAIFSLEEKIAEAHWAPAKRRNRDLTYNLKTTDELEAFAPGFSWKSYIESAGLSGQSEFIIREDDALQEISAIFLSTPVTVWRDYLAFHLIRQNADILPTSFDEANFAFYGTGLRGTPEQRARWKRGVSAVNQALGEAVGKIYVELHFPQDSKAKMSVLVGNLRQALDERLDTLAWMGEETKKQAHDKLNKFTPKIGYPDEWTDYSALEVVSGDAYGNRKRSDAFAWNIETGRLGGPIDQNEWGMTPQRVNAYYNPTRNEIVFPAAILQPPFFDPNADAAVNYGGIGAVIGHEIGHGFDDQGSKSDGDGRLRDWWDEKDRERFEALTTRLGNQFASYEPFPGYAIKPALTMGENIGDIGGLAMAYRAYKLSLNGEEAPILGGYTGDQRFFMAWAQVWKRVAREDAIKNQIETDPHSPARYRVNGVVRNMDAWYEAFDIKPEDALYLAPEDRVQIW